MIEQLTDEGYEQTKAKLSELQHRLVSLDSRTDLKPDHLVGVRNSYQMMIRQYLQEIKVYETKQK